MTYPYAIGIPSLLAGTVTISDTSASAAGVGTAFTSQTQVGDFLLVGVNSRQITQILDDLNLVVDTPYTTSASSATAYDVPMMNLENDLGIPAPKSPFSPYSTLVNLADGTVRGAGWRMTDWKWDFLTHVQRDALRVFCPSASNTVCMTTRTVDNNDEYQTYNAVIVWPQPPEDRFAGRRLNFAVHFQAMVPWQ